MRLGPVTLFLALASLVAFIQPQELLSATSIDSLADDLRIQDWMRALRRVKRAPTRSSQPTILGTNGTGRCIISADSASHYCGLEEVSAPPIPPPDEGKCIISKASGREICYPSYNELDTSCTDVTGQSTGLVAPPVIEHATVRAMAFVPPDNLRRLIMQYYRQHGKHVPKNATFSLKSFLFVKYHCDFGYEMVDEIDTLFCQNKEWVNTMPKCVGKGLCAINNGGCSHSCLSVDETRVECKCPRGMTLDADLHTCRKPIPKTLCRSLAGCSCSSIDDNQYTCTCPKGAKCLLLKGPPKIYVEPAGPYEVAPGGNINISCAAVAYPFPEIYWQRGNEEITNLPGKTGTVKSEQILIIKELYKNTDFTCHANNSIDKVERTVHVVITGPGSAPLLRAVQSGRTSITVRWEPPHIINRPITSYTIYYTNNGNQPIKNWKKLEVLEPNREQEITDLRPNTVYFVRLRANDPLGPGRLGNPVSVTTMKPAAPPELLIEQGEEIRVAPMTPFFLGCNVSHADPTPVVSWQHKGRPLSAAEKGARITIQHGGLLENTVYTCIAENEAGTQEKSINVVITGPSAPERIRYQIDGNAVKLQWEEPRVTNGEMAGYDVLYSDDPSLPLDTWKLHRIDSPQIKEARIDGLDEKKKYSFVIRGRNHLGTGLPTTPFEALTWLAPRPPTVGVEPPGQVEKSPSQDPLTVECEASGVPRPKIIWLWSGQLVEDGKDEFRVYDTTPIDAQDLARSKLIAQSTTRTGTATCQAVNIEGSDEKKTEVKIKGPGSAPLGIHPISMHSGFDVSWSPPKRPNGKIKNYIVYYTKNPDSPLSDWESQVVPADKLNLTVGVDDEDTPYVVKVQAATDDGPGIISEAYEVTTGRKQVPLTVRLEIIDPLIDPDGETVVEPSQPIHFRCITGGRPQPSVSYSWLPVNNSDSADEPVPIPIQADSDQEHRYNSIKVFSNTPTRRILLCQARNPDGSVEDRHIFAVNKPGSPPRDVNVIVDPDNRVTIDWQPPKYTNGDITGYRVYVTGDPTQPVDQWQIFPMDADTQKFVLERGELEPETPYYVKVTAVNPDGEGVQSDPTHFNTVSGAPLDSPGDIVPIVSEDNTINISWAAPKDPNGPLKTYTVYFTPDDGSATDDYKTWQRVEMLAGDDEQGTITLDKHQYDILPNTDYKIRIAAINDQSEGPASEPIIFHTGSGETPPIITLEPSEITIEPRGAVTAMCSATGIPQPAVFWILENGEKIEGGVLQLNNQLKDTSATCRAENKAGKTQSVLRILVNGPGSAPNEIVVLPMPDQQVNVEWTAPDVVNGKLDSYIIHYGELNEGETEPKEWKTTTAPGDAINILLPPLEPKQTYSVKVQAVSDRGPGVLSDSQVVRTLPLAPEAVTDTNFVVHPNNSITVSFVPPNDPEDASKKIKDFVIRYTTDDPATEDTEWKELKVTDVDETDGIVTVDIDGENFNPETKYTAQVIPRGEVDGPPSSSNNFETSDGIVPPSKPEFTVDAVNNTIRVPAGTDYSVTCISTGFPPPNIRWVDSEGNQLTESAVIKLTDVRRTKHLKCISENRGGLQETDFTVFVAGPGSSPENVQLSADRPQSIDVSWETPIIPNGDIRKYIVYYTPLDDQDPSNQLGQVQARPINEWLTYHHTPSDDKPLEATLKDFVNSDTAYAVVIQAINDDGPGPYSNQYTVRTMSKAREGPPVDLRVQPDGQRSANIEWKPPTTDVQPEGYEIFYVPGDKSVDVDEKVVSDWMKIVVEDPEQLSHKINNLLLPDTDYVFKIRAVYRDGPGVFSEPCITKTLPDGNAPYIQVSTGDNGVEGASHIDLLPGSGITVWCNATGIPQPEVKWIRAGIYEIDPSTVDQAESSAKFSLHVTNVSEDTTFNCVAQNPLGHANWTIVLNVVDELPANWKDDFVISKSENGEVVLHFMDNLPAYLRPPNDWVLRYTDDADWSQDQWTIIHSDGSPLTRLVIPDMLPGRNYYLTVESKGIVSPVLVVMTPKPPSDIRIGTNINDETVVDFKPAISSQPIEHYTIKTWKPEEPTNVQAFETEPGVTSGIVLTGLDPGTDYSMQIVADLSDGDELACEPVNVRTPPKDMECDCEHACSFEEREDGTFEPRCYCNIGFVLAKDGKICVSEEDTTQTYIVQR